MFAGFALVYSILIATATAIFCLIVAPFIGMHWYHWMISGLGFCLLTIGFVGGIIDTDFERSNGAANFWHGLFTIIVPPCAACVMGIVPLAHVPLAGWLVPGLFLVIVWGGLVGVAAGRNAAVHTTSKPARRTSSTPAPTIVVQSDDPTLALTSRPHHPDPSTSHDDITPGWRAWEERKYQIERSRRQR